MNTNVQNVEDGSKDRKFKLTTKFLQVSSNPTKIWQGLLNASLLGKINSISSARVATLSRQRESEKMPNERQQVAEFDRWEFQIALRHIQDQAAQAFPRKEDRDSTVSTCDEVMGFMRKAMVAHSNGLHLDEEEAMAYAVIVLIAHAGNHNVDIGKRAMNILGREV